MQRKSCVRTTTWECTQHGTGIAEIVNPFLRISAAGKLCSLRNNTILSHFCHCEEPSFTLMSVISMLPAVIYHFPKGKSREWALSNW